MTFKLQKTALCCMSSNMSGFNIELERIAGAGPDDSARVAIRSDQIAFTKLLRSGANAPDEFIQAPPAGLAFWLVDNWWRLISECVPANGPNAKWRLAHDLSSVGSYAWPRLSIWGEGDRIGLSSRSDPAGIVGPVRYLTDALTYIDRSTFEATATTFIGEVASERAGYASDWAALAAQYAQLDEERSDADLAAWRTLEAQLGYDVDEAPDALMETFGVFERSYGTEAIAEAALAVQGEQAAEALSAEIELTKEHGVECDLGEAAKLIPPLERPTTGAPWEIAEKAASAVRQAIGLEKGPLSHNRFSELLGVRRRIFNARGGKAPTRSYGVRLQQNRGGERVNLVSRWPRDRRFEFARALGDAIWSGDTELGLMTRSKTERQKFQRAFAQSLLCPYDELRAYTGDDTSDGALASAANHFLVSENVVRTLLVNKAALNRNRLYPIIPPAANSWPLEEAVEAA